MVQLKYEIVRETGEEDKGFNSCMVQLKSESASTLDFNLSRFNSCMVQLKLGNNSTPYMIAKVLIPVWCN